MWEEALTLIVQMAHDMKKIYKLTLPTNATVSDALLAMENTTRFNKARMMLVAGGRVLPTYISEKNIVDHTYLLVGNRLDAIDHCLPVVVEEGLSSYTYSETHPGTDRDGARMGRRPQEPRSVMIMWAADKIRRELALLNPLMVSMLLKAERRTISAALHTRSAAQTREVISHDYGL